MIKSASMYTFKIPPSASGSLHPCRTRGGAAVRQAGAFSLSRRTCRAKATRHTAAQDDQSAAATSDLAPRQAEGPSTDLGVVYDRFVQLALPYWKESPEARWKLAGVVGLTLATTGVSVVFSYLGRDFFNALSERDAAAFQHQLLAYLGGFAVGIPVLVYSDYCQARLALDWREWMTKRVLEQYFRDRSFYRLQSGGLVDNPDQRIAVDVRIFTDTALGLVLTALNSAIDLVSFAGILYTIYPPLFAALLVYAVGGTAAAVAIGKSLVKLNFDQEAREADLRYGLVRVRENAESIAFYGGEASEMRALMQRLLRVVSNYGSLLISSRNLDLFTSAYGRLVQLLPAAVVAPLFFQGKIDFGVVTQSQSAFSHVLSDVSLVVEEFEALAGFGAVVDRLGQFSEVAGRGRPAPPGPAGVAAPTAGAAAADDGDGGLHDAGGAVVVSATGSEAAGRDGATAGAPPSGITISHLPVAAAAAAATVAASNVDDAAVNSSSSSSSSSNNNSRRDGELLLELRGLSIVTPDGSNQLVQDLSLEVRVGDSLLIVGPSGAGKTSLLRALAGLWQTGSGSIVGHGLPGLGRPGFWHAQQAEAGAIVSAATVLSSPSSSAAAAAAAAAPSLPSPSSISASAPALPPAPSACPVVSTLAPSAAAAPSAAEGFESGPGLSPLLSSPSSPALPSSSSSSAAAAAIAGQAGFVPAQHGCVSAGVMFLPQKPYMVLGSLRDQLLYPAWSLIDDEDGMGGSSSATTINSSATTTTSSSSSTTTSSSSSSSAAGKASSGTGAPGPRSKRDLPTDQELEATLHRVQLGQLLERCRAASWQLHTGAGDRPEAGDPSDSNVGSSASGAAGAARVGCDSGGRGSSNSGGGRSGRGGRSQGAGGGGAGGAAVSPLDAEADWSQLLSLGEQQRLAFARLLLAAPRLALLDEATSALDVPSEARLYREVLDAGVTVVSVGHRPSLLAFHSRVLRLGPGPGAGAGPEWTQCSAEEYSGDGGAE